MKEKTDTIALRKILSRATKGASYYDEDEDIVGHKEPDRVFVGGETYWLTRRPYEGSLSACEIGRGDWEAMLAAVNALPDLLNEVDALRRRVGAQC